MMFDDETPAEEASSEEAEGGEDLEDMSAWGLEEGAEGEELDPSLFEKTPEMLKKQEDLERFGDVEVCVDIVLGTANMPVEQFLKIGRGAIIELREHKDDDVMVEVASVPLGRGQIAIQGDSIAVECKDIMFKNKIYSFDN